MIQEKVYENEKLRLVCISFQRLRSVMCVKQEREV